MTLYEQDKIQKTLKALMKQKKMNYKSMGEKLKVSSATIKRRLNGADLSLRQLKELAECLSLSLYEVIELSKQNFLEPHFFTNPQELILASELWIMNLFRMILAGLGTGEIKRRLNVPEKDLRRVMREFEKVGLAKLFPGDRFVATVQFPFRWQNDGPLSKAYSKLIVKNVTDRIEKDLGTAGINRQFEIALSPELYEKFCKDIQDCYEKYRGLSELYLSSRIEWSNLVSGIFFIDRFSPWDFPGRRRI